MNSIQPRNGSLVKFWKKKLLKRERRQRTRTRLFEQLERRDLLAAAVWHNVTQPLNVNADSAGLVSPTDALQVINALNSNLIPATHGFLPRQVDASKQPFLDVSCDGRVSPTDALMVINYLNDRQSHQSAPGQALSGQMGLGVYPKLACSPLLSEETELISQLSNELQVPFDRAAIRVTIQAPQFDHVSAAETMRDAFEIVLQGSNQQFVFPYATDTPAAFNWSEGLQPYVSSGAQIHRGAGDDISILIPLTGLQVNEKFSVTARLINNDGELSSSVILRGLELIKLASDIPSIPHQVPVIDRPEFDTGTLEALPEGVAVQYLRSSYDSSTGELLAEVAVQNSSETPIMGRLVIVVDDSTVEHAELSKADGQLADGRGYLDLSAELDGRPLFPGSTSRSRVIHFKLKENQALPIGLRALGMTETMLGAIESSPTTQALVNQVYEYQPLISDVDSPLQYNLIQAPDGMIVDSQSGRVTWQPSPEQLGQYSVVLRVQNSAGEFSDQIYVLSVESVLGASGENDDDGDDDGHGSGNAPPGAAGIYYLSVANPGKLKNSNKSQVEVDDSDIVKLSVYQNGTWFYEIFFDGSDVGLTTGTEDVDAFSIRPDGTMLFSTTGSVSVPGAIASGEDLLLFNPRALGNTTSGTWSLYFDGSDLGLSSWEGLDAVDVLPDGRLLISTDRAASVNGLSNVQNADLLVVNLTSTGANTAGTFQFYFDGSDVGLSSSTENLDAVAIAAGGSNLLVSTTGKFQVPNLSGNGSDAFTFRPTLLGANTSGTYLSPLTLVGSRISLNCDGIDALELAAVGQPPTITAVGSQSISELVQWQLQLNATDPDTAPSQLRWSVVVAPVGVSLNETSGLLNWTPTEAQGPGVYPLVVAVTDGSNSTSATFTVTVREVNQAPQVSPISDPTVDEGSPLIVQLNASDADLPAQTLSYTLGIGSPVGATISNTGLIRWTPSEAEGPGEFTVIAIVKDSLEAETTITFPVTVREVNQSPALATIADQTVNSGTTLLVTAQGTDPDLPANSLTYSLLAAPAGATINAQSGLITWVANQAGSNLFTVRVTDGGGLSANTSFHITVGGMQLNEETRFSTEATEILTVPNNHSALRVRFTTPTFDTTSQNSMRDAFEIEVTDATGNPLALPWMAGATANYNWSESLEPVYSSTVASVTAGSGGASSASINLSGLAEGTQVKLHLRLVNNDSDNNTMVSIEDYGFVDALGVAPSGMSFSSTNSAPSEPVQLSNFTNLSSSLVSNYDHSTLTNAGREIVSELSLTNQSNLTVAGRLLAVVDNLSDPMVHLVQPSGFLTDGRPYVELTEKIDNGSLAPGQTTAPHQLRFANESGQRFTYRLAIYAEVNTAPQAFSSIPLAEIEAGKTYRHLAQASDTQPIVYSIVTGPQTMQINSTTGQINWPTQSSDIGRHSVVIRATDPFGLYVEQRFDIQVLLTLQNRPPVFTSVPGTEATAASGFEVLTLATGSNPTGLAAGDFGSRNSSLVAINAGDQSLSYLAGLGLDQFAVGKTVDIGEPRPTDAAIRSGIGVDLGLPTYVSPRFDQNKIDGFATADFNGDGILDTSVIARTKYRNESFSDVFNRFLVVNLGNGDGTFAEPTQYQFPGFPVITEGSSMLAMDFDRDGKVDLLALDTQNYTGFLSSLIFYKGVGDGTFATATKVDTATPVFAMQAADFNGDGKLDLLVEKAQQNGFGIQLGNGDGTFAAYTSISTVPSGGSSSFTFSFGDLNGDGDLDVVYGDWGRSKLVVLQNNGDATFTAGPELISIQPLASQGLTSVPSAVVVGEFTGDGKVDIAYGTINTAIDGGGLGLYVGDGTGTQFSYQVAQSDRLPERLLNAGGNATPIDIDSDGDLDLQFISRSRDGNRSTGIIVGLNDGSGHFATTSYVDASDGVNQQLGNANYSLLVGALVGDFNRDGMLDLLSAESNQSVDYSRLNVLLADRPGVFRSPTAVQLEQAAHGNVRFLMAGDFNNDGVVDIWGPQYQGVSVTRLGNGDGTFGSGITATPYIGNENLAPGFVTDLNKDGNLDVVWLGQGGVQGGPIPRYLAALGNGDGTFQISYSENANAQAIEPGDFNHDGFVDFAARGFGNFVIMLNDPAHPGTFIQSSLTPLNPGAGESPSITVQDFDSDGKLDVVVVLNDSNNPPHRLQFYHGNGDGTVSSALTSSILAKSELLFPKWLSSADLNHDGLNDLVMTAAYGRSAVLLGKGDGSFGDPIIYASGTYSATVRNLTLRDVDGDGNVDMVNYDDNPGFGRITLRHGLGDGTFGAEQGYDYNEESASFAIADFDNDGRTDFVVKNLINSEAVVYMGSRPGLSDVITVDIDSDGNLDVLAINNDNSHVKRLIGNGQGDFSRLTDLLVGPGPVALATGDFNVDGKVDFVTANRSGKSLSVMQATDQGFYSRTDIPLNAIPLDVQIADLNGDGKLDLSVIDTFHNTLQVLLGIGAGAFQPPQLTPLGDQPGSLALSDTNSDGKVDAVVTLPQSERIMILPGVGNGTFAAPSYVSTSSAAKAVSAADLNQDGVADLVFTLPSEDRVAVRFGIGNNRFAEPQNIRVGAQPGSLVLQDANHDGRTDILVANSGDSTASVILNKYDATQIYSYQAVAVDPDADPVNYTMVSGPGGMIFDASTGQLRWAPSADQVGLQQVVLEANDGRGGVATQQFSIAVAPAQANASPVITSEPSSTIPGDSEFAYSASAVDNDHDALRYRIVSGPTGATIDPTSGLLEWDPRGHALKLNENANQGGVLIPNSASLGLSSYTVEGWFSFDATSNQILISKDAPGQKVSYGLRYQFGVLKAIVGDGSSEASASLSWTPVIGKAYHISGTFDAPTGALKLLINGNIVAQTNTAQRITNFDSPLYLGYTNQDPFKGKMSQVRVWIVARLVQDIQAGMEHNFDGPTANLIADFRFDEGETLSIVDTSGNQLNGRLFGDGFPRRVAGIAPASTTNFTISVEDGRGGVAQQSFPVRIVSQLRGNISGIVFNDSNNDGVKQSGESVLANHVVYLDSYPNFQLDQVEFSTTSDANGNYQFNNLVSDNYQVRVKPQAGFIEGSKANVAVASQQTATANVPVVPVQLGQLRGTIHDDHALAAAHMQVFADLDQDGFIDSNEPSTSTDDFGRYALAGLAAGSYSVRVNSRPGWKTSSPSAAAHDVVLATNATLNNLDFVVSPNNELSRSQPVMISAPVTTAQARTGYSAYAFAYDPSGSAIRYSLSLAPTGMAIDAVTGHIVWTPEVIQVGSQRVVARAMNATGAVALQEFTIAVAPPNSSPIVTSKPASPISAGTPFSYAIAAQDAEQSLLQYTMLSGPSGASVNNSSGVVSWTPTIADVGDHNMVIQISDGLEGVTQHAFTLTVQSGTIATTPFVIYPPRSDASLLSEYLSRVDGVDATGQVLSTQLLSGPAGLTLSSTGLIQWMPTTAQLGSQTVSVRFSSPTGSTEDRQFTIHVKQIVANIEPTITSAPTKLATVGQLYSYDVIASDEDSDALAFELLSAPAGMSINPATGLIRWWPASDQRGTATVTLRLNDPQGGEAQQSFELLTRAVGGPPNITSIPPTQVAVGQSYLYTMTAVDAEKDPIQFALLQSPPGMTINSRTGELSWTPTNGDVGQQSVIISATDGRGGTSTQGFAIRVSAGIPNASPIFASQPSLLTSVGQAYSYASSATDPEGTTLTHSLRTAPSGMTINAQTGLVSWTPTASQTGRFVVTVAAADVGGAVAVQSYELDVLSVNRTPSFISSSNLSVYAGTELNFEVVAQDADRDPISYQIVSGAPSGMNIDALGRLTWATTAAHIGNYVVQLSATDPRGGLTTQTLAVQVLADTVAPRVTVLPTPGGWPWDGPIIVFVSAVDNVGITNLELKVNNIIVPLDSNHSARLYAEDWGFGTLSMVATARDAAGNVGTGNGVSFYRNPDIDYETHPSLPTAIVTSPQLDATVAGIVEIVGTAAGSEFKEYRLSYARADLTNFTEFVHSTAAVTDGVLGNWDTSMLENDAYVIRLEVTDVVGSTNAVDIPVGLSGSLKLGNFRVSFEDMTIPLAGIPITIARTYDTLRADRDGDFGYGWRLEFRDTDLRTSLPKSGLEGIGIYTPFKQGAKVYLTLPGGGRQGFTFTPEYRILPGFGQGNNLVIAFPRFTPDRGVTSRLSAGGGSLLVNEFGEMYASGGVPWNPASPDFAGYTLTTADGLIYRIDGSTGLLTTVTDQNQNKLTFTDSGINGPDNVAISFERDAKGRITKVIDTAGNGMNYDYDGAGNLRSVSDRVGNTTTFGYLNLPVHYLETITDPLGRTGTRSVYGTDGRLTSSVDSMGNRTNYSYDPANSVARRTDANGNPVIVEYDPRGNVVRLTDAAGGIVSMTYDLQDNLLSRTDEVGNAIHFSYNDQGNLINTIDALGNQTRTTYNAMGMPIATVDALGSTSIRTYDEFGNQTSLTDRLGETTSYSVDRSGNIVRVVDAAGAIHSSTYDARGNVLTQTDPLGNTRQYAYDLLGNVTREISSVMGPGGLDSREITYTYDANGKQLSMVDAAGKTTRFTYDAAGNQVSTTDVLGNVTQLQYSSDNLLTTVTRPDGSQSMFAYDGVGNRTQTSSGNADTTWHEYDALGRLIAVMFPDDTPGNLNNNPRKTFEYDAAGNEIANTDERGNRTVFKYDPLNRLIETIDAAGAVYRVEYDALGRLTSQTDPLGRTTQFKLDAESNLTSVTYADGTSASYAYEPIHRLAVVIDELGNTKRQVYDSKGQLIQVIDSANKRTNYAYDEAGNLIAVTDAAGRVTRYEYDKLDRQTATISPLGFRSTVEYDAVGNPVRQIDADLRVTQNEFDAAGRLKRRVMPDSSVATFAYNNQGELVEMVDSSGTSTMTYDVRGHLLSRTSGDGKTISYEYDAVGNRTKVTTPGGVTNYNFGSTNRLISMTSSVGGTTSYSYDLSGNLIATAFADGSQELMTYDNRDRLLGRSLTNSELAGIQSFSYNLLANGLIESITEVGASNRTVHYQYDSLNRLTEEAIADGATQTIKYTYDAVGNRLSRNDSVAGLTTYHYDADDRLLADTNTGIGTTTYAYDNSGNLLSKNSGANSSTFTYFASGKLATAAVTEGGQTHNSSYVYTADGLRIRQIEDGVQTNYLIDTNRPYSEIIDQYNASGVQKHYIVDSSVNSVVVGLAVHAMHKDAIGSVRVITSNGVVTGSSVSDAFGQTLVSTGNAAQFPGFAGRLRDGITGLVDMRARDYDVTTGRFRGADIYPASIGLPDTLHRYAFAGNNPVNFSDPSGYFTLAEQLVSTGLVSDLMKSYSKNLGKLFLTSVRICECTIRPGQQMRLMGARLMEAGVPRGENMYEIGTSMVVAGLTELGSAIKQAYKDIATDIQEGIKQKYSDLGKPVPKPSSKGWLDDMEDYFKKQSKAYLKLGIKEKFKKGQEYVENLRTYITDLTVMLDSNDPCEQSRLVETYGKTLLDKFFR